MFAEGDVTLAESVGLLLRERGLSLGLAESCTGGLITSRLTDVAGSSRYVQESVVTYANEAKTSLLGVAPELIAAHGAVSEETAREMTKAYRVPRGFRGLGWDKDSPYSSNRGDLFSEAAFGHGGFTGTAIWIDPEQELFVIFLSNRVHPDGKGSVNPLAGRIGTVAAAAIGD